MLKALKRPLSIILAFCLIMGMAPIDVAHAAGNTIYVSSVGNDTNDGSQGTPLATVQEAYSKASNGDTIFLLDDLDSEEGIVLDEGKEITLTSDNKSLTYIGTTPLHNGTEGFLTVTDGEVTISNLSVQLPDAYGTNGRVLAIKNASVTLEVGATIANGYVVYGGGGVRVESGGTLIMCNGATIEKCYIANNTSAYGGGVEVVSGGTFIMNGGKISNNTIHTTTNYESFGGGVAVESGARFEMYGGEITDNQVDTAAGGLFIDPAATVYMEGSLKMNGNTVDGKANNLYLPDKNAFDVLSNVSGEVGITCGRPDYEDIVGVPNGYSIDVTDEDAFFYDDGTYDICLKNGNLVLYWWTVDVEIKGDDVTSENDATETPKGEDYDTVLKPAPGNKLPDEIEVTVDGEILNPDTDYTYNPDTGEVHIPGENVTGDIVIDATGEKLYTITVVTTNVMADRSLIEDVTKKDTYRITLSKIDKYSLPDDVTITGACVSTYIDGQIEIKKATSDIVVLAEGKDIYHKITFDPNGGECDVTEKNIPESQDYLGTLPEPDCDGYTFVGWVDEDGNRYTANTENNMKDDLNLHAEWSANTNIAYKIQHWIEYVDSGVNPGYESGTTETKVVGAKTYYLFKANVYNNGTADAMMDLHPYLLNAFAPLDINGIIPSASNVYSVKMAVNGTSVFDLFYYRQSIMVTFDPNGGDALNQNVATATVTYGGLYGIMPNASRTGYTQAGWHTEAAGGDLRVQGDVCLMTENHSLYAYWQSNGNTLYKVVHKLQPLNDNLPVTDSSAYTVYKSEDLHGTSDETVDVYSISIPGFTARKDNPKTVYVKADGSAYATLFYDRNSVKMIYDANGGTPVNISHTVYYGGTISSLAKAPSRVGYDFVGWFSEASAGNQVHVGNAIHDLNPDNKAEVALYAHWTPRTYKVPLETYGGTASGELWVTYDDAVGALPTASKEGYTFTEWLLKDGTKIMENMLVNKDTIIDVTLNGSESAKTFYAQYVANSVTLTFDPTSGNPISNNTLRVTYDKTYKECGTFPVATKDGYVFLNWTFKDGKVLDENDVCKLTEDTTVYANYINKHFNVYFDANGGQTPNPTEKVVTYGEKFGDLASTSRTGYTFLGWFTQKTGGTQITATSVVEFTTDTTLYAQWNKNSTGGNGGGSGGSGGGVTSYIITSSADEGATITPEGKISVKSGNNQEFTMRAAAGYMISDVLVDGKSVGKVSTYTFSNVKANHTIEVKASTLLTDSHIAYLVGYPGNTMRADSNITRAEAAMIFYRLLSATARDTYQTSNSPYSDVNEEWYAQAVSTLSSMNILTGYDDGAFRPNQNIKRAEFATLAARFDNLENGSVKFSDVPTTYWAYGSIASAATKGWVSGYEDGTFRPENNITRAEVARITNAVLNRTADKTYLANNTGAIKSFTDLQNTHWAYYDIMEAVHEHQYTRNRDNSETWRIA